MNDDNCKVIFFENVGGFEISMEHDIYHCCGPTLITWRLDIPTLSYVETGDVDPFKQYDIAVIIKERDES